MTAEIGIENTASMKIPESLKPSSPWTPKKGLKQGQARIYLNEWMPACGASIDRYKSGNVCYAEYDGRKISNACAYRNLVNAKVWVGVEDGAVHADYVIDDSFRKDIEEKVAKAIREANVDA